MSVFTLYRCYAANGDLLYIGLTVNPGQRLTHHARKKQWWTDVAEIKLEQHADYATLVSALTGHEAAWAEHQRFKELIEEDMERW